MAVIDEKNLLERLDGDQELAEELLEIFREVASSMLGAVREAVEARDSEALARAAHDLKGSAANISAAALCEVAERLEKLGRAGRADQAAGELEQLDDAAQRLFGVLDSRT